MAVGFVSGKIYKKGDVVDHHLFYMSSGKIYAEPVLSFTIWLSDLIFEKINIPPMNAAITRIRKNIFLSVKSSQKPVITPATLPPMDVERNHPPIIRAVSLAGASLETNDKPIGLKNISLIVKTK